MKKNSAFGKNNFDRLEAAGLIAGADQTEQTKHKLEQRILALSELVVKVGRVETHLAALHTLPAERQMKRVANVLEPWRELYASSLPVKSKRHIGSCLNELLSIYEGLSSGLHLSEQELTLSACAAARLELMALVTASKQRLESTLAESADAVDRDKFWSKTSDVIESNMGKALTLSDIKTHPVVVLRTSVIPADDKISADRMTSAGFDVDNMGGYAVFNNQLVIGISSKHVAAAAAQGKAISNVREMAESMRRQLQRQMNLRLQFVSQQSYPYETGAWFWLMTDRELDRLARVSGGGHVKIQRWGFAF